MTTNQMVSTFQQVIRPRAEWMAEVEKLFPLGDFELARKFYRFEAAHDDGLTPQQAFNDFNDWIDAGWRSTTSTTGSTRSNRQ